MFLKLFYKMSKHDSEILPQNVNILQSFIWFKNNFY